MQKGERSKELIRQRAAAVFNIHGYSGATINALTAAAGFEKGAIYGHFAGKEALALAAFDYAAQQQHELFAAALASGKTASEQLLALTALTKRIYEEPPVPGGCPVMNTAIEADDTHPALRAKAQSAMQGLLALVGNTVKSGIASGEFRSDVSPRHVATVLVALVEGSLMLSKLFGDPVYIDRMLEQATHYVQSLQIERSTT